MNVDAAATFLSSCFFRTTKAEATRDVVNSFVQTAEGKSSAWMIASQLDLIADQRIYATDDEWLYRVYRCGFVPSQQGLNASEWVRDVAGLVRSASS